MIAKGVRPKRRPIKNKVIPPKMGVVVEKTTRFVIMSKTEEGRLVEPTSRKRYDCSDSNPFDWRGYPSFNDAETAIVDFVTRREHSTNEHYASGMYIHNGKTPGETEEFLIIPFCEVSVYRKVIAVD